MTTPIQKAREEADAEFDEKFPGIFYQELTVRGISGSYNAVDELKSHIHSREVKMLEQIRYEVLSRQCKDCRETERYDCPLDDELRGIADLLFDIINSYKK